MYVTFVVPNLSNFTLLLGFILHSPPLLAWLAPQMAGPHSRSKSPPRSSPKSDGASKVQSRLAPPPTDGEADKVPAKPVPEQQNVGVGAPSRSKSCIGILFVVLGSLVLATSMVASNPNAVQEIQMAVQEIQMAVQEIQMQMVKIIAQKELKQAFDRRIDLELALAKSTNEVAILQNSTAGAIHAQKAAQKEATEAQKEAAAAKQKADEAQKEAAAAKQEKTEAYKAAAAAKQKADEAQKAAAACSAAAAKQEKTEAQKAAAADKQKAEEAQKAAATDKQKAEEAQKAARRPRAAKGSTSEAEDN